MNSMREIFKRCKAELELANINQKLKQLSSLDGLTKIANRRILDQQLRNEWKRLQRERKPLSFILCDIDHFKQYNDTYGHQQGDGCLVAIAQAIKQNLRRPADLAARYGGEEFAILLPDTNAEGAFHIAEMLRLTVLNLQT